MLPQIIANALIAASIYFLVGVGFALIYRTAGFLHFAHGAVIAVGAYAAFLLADQASCPLLLAAIFSVGLCAILGVLTFLCVHRSLIRKRASALVHLLASLGTYIVIQNVISLTFGDDARALRSGRVVEGFIFVGARITSVQLLAIGTSILAGGLLWAVMRRTSAGRSIRAVADNQELAEISGLSSIRTIAFCFAAGSGLAAAAGILSGLDTSISPTMGLHPLIMGVVAVVIGGQRRVMGVAVGAVLLAVAQNFAAWAIGNQWQDAIAFVILLAFLLFRPEGFMGKRVRKATV